MQVNAVTIKDAYPLPRINVLWAHFPSQDGSARWICLQGAGKSPWIQLAGASLPSWLSQDCTSEPSFPSSLTSSPSTCERLMELILSGLKFETCLIYLDDVIVYGKRSQRKWNTKRFSHGLNLLNLGLNQANVCCFSRASRTRFPVKAVCGHWLLAGINLFLS